MRAKNKITVHDSVVGCIRTVSDMKGGEFAVVLPNAHPVWSSAIGHMLYRGTHVLDGANSRVEDVTDGTYATNICEDDNAPVRILPPGTRLSIVVGGGE